MQINRISLSLSISACALAIFSFLRPNNNQQSIEISNTVEKIVTNLLVKRPHIILDALNVGIISKRDTSVPTVVDEVNRRQEEIKEVALKIGNGKTEVICFFDTSDIFLQRNILNNLKDISFYLLPIDLNNNQIVNLYYSIYLYDKTKLPVFIETLIKTGNVNKTLKVMNIKKEKLKNVETISIQKLNKNTKLAKALQITAIPTLFINKDKKGFNILLTGTEDFN